MKKYRFAAFLLALILLISAVPPAAALEPDGEPHATAALVVDGDNDVVLYEYHAREKRYPASVTKIMTSLVVLDAVASGELSLDTQVTASATAVDVPFGSSTADPPIKAGEIMTVENLLWCDLLPSACEACNVLAEAVTGLTGDQAAVAFAQRMNAKAAALGMKDSHFTNPHGLHDDDHYTTAYDIYLMAREAMKNETFRTIVGTASHTIPATNLCGERTLYTTNGLISGYYVNGYRYPKAIGIKTGNTDEAGRCLASAATDEEGRTYYCVILGSEYVREEDGSLSAYSFSETIRLLEWAFANFHMTTLLDAESADTIRSVPVTLSDQVDQVLVQAAGSIQAVMPSDYDPARAELRFDLPDSVEAPVNAGDKLGTVTFTYEGKEYGSLDLVAADTVERSEFLYNLQRLENLWARTWVKVLVIGGAVILLLLILWLILLRPRRRRRYSYSGGGRSRSSYRGRR